MNTLVTCVRCAATAETPPPSEESPGGRPALWDAGWRWRGAPERAGIAGFVPRDWIVSCPDCPPVI